jgi:hypothetical protein
MKRRMHIFGISQYDRYKATRGRIYAPSIRLRCLVQQTNAHLDGNESQSCCIRRAQAAHQRLELRNANHCGFGLKDNTCRGFDDGNTQTQRR